jgi:hypothetical protein
MLNLYCVNVFKGEILEGQKFIVADTAVEAKEKARDNVERCQEFDYVPVRIIANTGKVFPVKKDEVMDEFKNPTYGDNSIIIDEYNISIIEFQDENDCEGLELTYDIVKSNEFSLVMRDGHDLFNSLVEDGTIDRNSTKEYSIIATNKRTEEVQRVYIKINK